MTKSTTKNIAANYGSRLWGLVSIYLFIPFYLKLLGIEAYAVISFYSLILGLVSFADAGLSSAITREFAKVSEDNYKFAVLKIIERKYAFVCLSISIVLIIAAQYIASKWLNSNGIPLNDLAYYIRLISVGVSLQLMTSIYFGALMGLQKQVTGNLIQICWNISKTGGAVVVLYLFKPSLYSFFCFQIACNVGYLYFLRLNLIKSLEITDYSNMIAKLPAEVIKYLSGMIVIAFFSSVNIYADRIVTSKLFSLRDFGYYSLASMISQLPVLISLPIVIAIFPVLTKAISEHDKPYMITTFKRFSFIVSCITWPICIVILLYSKDLILLWTHSKGIEAFEINKIQLVAKLLTVGSTFLALQLMPFYLLLANGLTKYTIKQNIIQVMFVIPALYISIKLFGLTGAGVPWLIINLMAMIYLIYIITSKFIPGNKLKEFIFPAITIPALVSFLVGIVFYFITLNAARGVYVILYAFILVILCLLLNVYVYNISNNGDSITRKTLINKPL